MASIDTRSATVKSQQDVKHAIIVVVVVVVGGLWLALSIDSKVGYDGWAIAIVDCVWLGFLVPTLVVVCVSQLQLHSCMA